MKCSLLSASRRIVPPIAATNKSERKAQEEVAFEAQQKQTKGENPWKYKKKEKKLLPAFSENNESLLKKDENGAIEKRNHGGCRLPDGTSKSDWLPKNY